MKMATIWQTDTRHTMPEYSAADGRTQRYTASPLIRANAGATVINPVGDLWSVLELTDLAGLPLNRKSP